MVGAERKGIILDFKAIYAVTDDTHIGRNFQIPMLSLLNTGDYRLKSTRLAKAYAQ